MKKVLFASKDLSMGGMEKALLSLLSAIDKDVYDVTLVLEKVQGPLLSELDERIKVIEYKVSSFKFSPIRKAVNFLRRIAFKIKHGRKYDFSCCYATYSAPCEKIAKISSDNCVLYVHSDYVAMYDGNVEKAKEFYDSIGISGYRKVLFVSESGREAASKIYPQLAENFLTLGNLVDFSHIEKASCEIVNFPDPDGKKVFIFVGRLDDTSKRLKRLLYATKILLQKREDFELWIIGKGPDDEMYKEYAKCLDIVRRVRFMGEISNPYPYIKKADCLVLTSDYEGFPVVYSEAAVLGVPIITTVPASDGFFVVDSSNAMVSEKNPESVAKNMLEFLEKGSGKIPFADFDSINSKKIKILYRNVDR